MIYLLEIPQWEGPLNVQWFVPSGLPPSTLFHLPQSYNRLRPFCCVASGSELEPGIIYEQITLNYRLHFTDPASESWYEVVFKNLYATACDTDIDGTKVYTCNADDFMVTLSPRDKNLNWLNQQAK